MASSVPDHKVILFGEYGAGKSSLFRRFVDNSFNEASGQHTTIGLDNFAKTFTVGGQQIKLRLWDTAGIERFATLSSSYFQSASAAILVYSIDNQDSFSMLPSHILEVVMHTQTAKMFLCGTKTDLDKKVVEVTEEHVEQLKEQYDECISGTFRVSCKTGEGIKEMFQQIAGVLIRDSMQKFDPSKIKPHERVIITEQTNSQCCSSRTYENQVT